MVEKSSSLQRKNRRIMPGFPWEGKFQTREEIDDYFSDDQIQCLLCGKWYKVINYAHLSRIHDTTVDEYKERYGLPWSRGLTGESIHEKFVKIGKECLVDGKVPWLNYRARRKIKVRRRRPAQPFEKVIRRLTIEEMRKIAQQRGGKCLSSVYIDSKTNLLWQCSEGHQWKAPPAGVKHGSWCLYCAGKAKGTIKEMRQIARERGGKCLSATYISRHTKLLWQCSKGHQWKAQPNSVKYGKWCPFCAGVNKGTIEGMRKIARERSGKCLSPTYVNSKTKLLWQCSKGHQWRAKPCDVKTGSWCPFCAGKARGTIKEMRQIAWKRSGECISSTYINSYTKLLWQCSKGHQWKATPRSVKRGTWCPYCAGVKKGTIKEMQKIARERGGKCLSSTYTNNRTKLLWQCLEGHQWEAKPVNVKFGQWCPICAKARRSKKRKSSK